MISLLVTQHIHFCQKGQLRLCQSEHSVLCIQKAIHYHKNDNLSGGFTQDYLDALLNLNHHRHDEVLNEIFVHLPERHFSKHNFMQIQKFSHYHVNLIGLFTFLTESYPQILQQKHLDELYQLITKHDKQSKMSLTYPSLFYSKQLLLKEDKLDIASENINRPGRA